MTSPGCGHAAPAHSTLRLRSCAVCARALAPVAPRGADGANMARTRRTEHPDRVIVPSDSLVAWEVRIFAGVARSPSAYPPTRTLRSGPCNVLRPMGPKS
eukprot:1987077-Prymnesium_polylepis.2